MQAKTVAIIYGGKSTEHEVSILSARNIAEAVDREKYNLLLIAVAKDGKWFLKSEEELKQEDVVNENSNQLCLTPGEGEKKIRLLRNQESIGSVDVIFPIVHGTGGEDGSLQGLLKTMNIAFVGSGVIGSALCIDKEVAKRMLNEAGITNSKFLSYRKTEVADISYDYAVAKLGTPMYIKPPNLGSSVGISKVATKEEFDKAISYAFRFDRKVLIEESIAGREIECAVMGNGTIRTSTVGEVCMIDDIHTFYSYDAKYSDASGSVTVIPADISSEKQAEICEIAIKTYRVLECEGMARVDVFLAEGGEVVVNEVNTLPGFTDISMYPKLWEAAGKTYSELISDLLDLALERHEDESHCVVDLKRN